jgi:hypothetical protein
MSQAAAKVSRRQIRKALGPDTVDTVQRMAAGLDNHAEHLEKLKNDVGSLQAWVAGCGYDYAVRISNLKKEIGGLRALRSLDLECEAMTLGSLERQLVEVQAVQARGFFGRLKWLVLGR